MVNKYYLFIIVRHWIVFSPVGSDAVRVRDSVRDRVPSGPALRAPQQRLRDAPRRQEVPHVLQAPRPEAGAQHRRLVQDTQHPRAPRGHLKCNLRIWAVGEQKKKTFCL